MLALITYLQVVGASVVEAYAMRLVRCVRFRPLRWLDLTPTTGSLALKGTTS